MAEEVAASPSFKANGHLIRQDGYWMPAYDADDAPRLVPYLMKMAKDATLTAAMAKRHEVCVQAGGHVGIWPLALAWMFEKVLTFEPQNHAYDALMLNTSNERRITAFHSGLGSQIGSVGMQPGADSGTWRCVPGEGHAMTTIDALNLPACDAIFLDLEGGEADALNGARRTIARFRPMLHIEILPRSRDAIAAVMKSLPYRFVRSVHKDSIYAPV